MRLTRPTILHHSVIVVDGLVHESSSSSLFFSFLNAEHNMLDTEEEDFQ